MKNHPLIQKLAVISKPLAYFLFAISTIAWSLVFVVPFLDFSAAEIAVWITALIIIGEVAFYLAILLLGKTLWNKMKAALIKQLPDEIQQKFVEKTESDSKKP